MRQPVFRFLVAWLCLFSFGLDMAVHALGPVVCVSENGARFEWSCERDDHGDCLRTGRGAEKTSDHHGDGRVAGQDQTAPCRDVPVDDDHDQAHHLFVQAKQNGHAEFTLPPVTLAVLPPVMFQQPVRPIRAGPEAVARPPDALARLASIVMIV